MTIDTMVRILNNVFTFFTNRICEVILVINIILSFAHQKENGKWEHIIRADGVGYYSVLPAVIIYQDPNFSFLPEIKQRYKSDEYNGGFLVTIPEGKMDKYYIGLSILWLPFFLIAHFLAYIAGYTPDGYSEIYHILILLSASLYLWVGCRSMRKLILNYSVPNGVVALLIVFIVYGTNLSHHATYDTWSTHVYSFGIISLFLYQCDVFCRLRENKRLYCLAILLGLIVLIRPTNAVIALMFPFFLGSFRECMNILKEFWKTILCSFLLFLAVLSLQFLFYYAEVGKLFVWSYDWETFDFTNPQIKNVLFSYRKGLLVYTPLFFIGLLGLVYLYRHNKFRFGTMVLLCVMVVYIISSWWSWWYGCSLGERPFNDYVGVLALMLVFLYKELKNAFLIGIFCFMGILLVIYSQVLSYQYQKCIIDWQDMTKKKYWFSFMRTAPEYEGLTWQKNFFLDDYPVQLIGLRSVSNKKFVCSDKGRNILATVSDISKSWETYNLINVSGNKIALRADNGKFVSVDTANQGILKFNSEKIGETEIFERVIVKENRLYLKVFNNKFVTLKTDTLSAIGLEQSEAALFEVMMK